MSRGPLRGEGRLCARPGPWAQGCPGAKHPGAESRAGRDQPRGRLPCEDRAGPAGDVREGGHHEGLWENQLGHTGQRLGGRDGGRARVFRGTRSCSWELSHQLRGDGLSGEDVAAGPGGPHAGGQGQVGDSGGSLRPQPLMCDGRTGNGGSCAADSGGPPPPLWASTRPLGQDSRRASGSHRAPRSLGKFLICSETLFLVHKVRTRCSPVVRLLMCGCDTVMSGGL